MNKVLKYLFKDDLCLYDFIILSIALNACIEYNFSAVSVVAGVLTLILGSGISTLVQHKI